MNKNSITILNECLQQKVVGKTHDEIIAYLREQGCSKVESITIMMRVFDIGLNDAKEMVHLSQTWADVRVRDDRFQQTLEKMSPDSTLLNMNEAEKTKSTMMAVFARKGANGSATRIFDDLSTAQKIRLLHDVRLDGNELPIIGNVESDTMWLLLTTERLIWRRNDENRTLGVQEIRHVEANFRKLVMTGRKKEEMRELEVLSMTGGTFIIEVEQGAPLVGLWNVLLIFAARNRPK